MIVNWPNTGETTGEEYILVSGNVFREARVCSFFFFFFFFLNTRFVNGLIEHSNGESWE